MVMRLLLSNMLILASLKVAAPMFTVALRYYLKKKQKTKLYCQAE